MDLLRTKKTASKGKDAEEERDELRFEQYISPPTLSMLLICYGFVALKGVILQILGNIHTTNGQCYPAYRSHKVVKNLTS
jgi:hypothetical protein